MIRTLADLTEDIYQDAAGAVGPTKKKYINLSTHLEALALKGEVDPSLIRFGKDAPRKLNGQPVSAVEQMLGFSGVHIGHPHDMNSSSCGVFIEGNAEFVSGANILFPAFAQEIFENKLLAVDRFTSRRGVAGDTVYPKDVLAGFIDQSVQPDPRQVAIEAMISSTVGVNGDGYKTAVLDDSEVRGMKWSRVAERAEMPLYKIKLGERTIEIVKFGAAVDISYEALRRMRINELQITLQWLAVGEAERQVDQAIEIALNGDGNLNPAFDTPTVGGPVWTIGQLNAWAARAGYERGLNINYVIGNFDEVFGDGQAPNPLGVWNLRYAVVDVGGSHTPPTTLTPTQQAMFNSDVRMPDGSALRLATKTSALAGVQSLLGFNTAQGLQRVVENGSQIEETQRFIRNQTEVMTMSVNLGFAKPLNNSFETITRV